MCLGYHVHLLLPYVLSPPIPYPLHPPSPPIPPPSLPCHSVSLFICCVLCRHGILESVDRAKCKIKAKRDNVAGVALPVFETFVDGGDSEQSVVDGLFGGWGGHSEGGEGEQTD